MGSSSHDDYLMAIMHAGKAIALRPDNHRAYICRACSKAEIIKDFVRGTSLFADQCKTIWEDIAQVKQLLQPHEFAQILLIEENIQSILQSNP